MKQAGGTPEISVLSRWPVTMAMASYHSAKPSMALPTEGATLGSFVFCSCRNWCSHWIAASFVVALTVCSTRLDAAESRSIGGIQLKDGRVVLASVYSQDQILIRVGREAEWVIRKFMTDSAVLVPKSPLVLLDASAPAVDAVRVFTIDSSGRLVRILLNLSGTTNGAVAEPVFSADLRLQFPPGSGFAVSGSAGAESIFAVDSGSRLLELSVPDLNSAVTPTSPSAVAPVIVCEQTDSLLPGSFVNTLDGFRDEVFVIDRRGCVVSWVRDPVRTWKGPQLIGTGFLSGSDPAVWQRPDGAREIYVAAVNAAGELRMMKRETQGWRMDIAPGWLLPPGSPVSVSHAPINIRLFAVTGSGVIQEMHYLNTEWRQRSVGAGIQPGNSVWVQAQNFRCFAEDASGDLLTASNVEEKWKAALVSTVSQQAGAVLPDDTSSGNQAAEAGPAASVSVVATDVLKREWAIPESESAETTLWNTSSGAVTLKIRNRLNLSATQEVRLDAGKSFETTLSQHRSGSITTHFPETAPEAERLRAREAEITGPVEIEVLSESVESTYQDLRIQRYPRNQPGRKCDASLGRFVFDTSAMKPEAASEKPRPDVASDEGRAAEVDPETSVRRIEIDVIRSAGERRTVLLQSSP
jgi:hypothetical protein